MTVIAYRNGIICSDSNIWSGDILLGAAEKVWKNNSGWISAAAGNYGDCTKFRDWFLGEFDWNEIPDMKSVAALMVSPSKETFMLDELGTPYELSREYFADGIGLPVALGAFYMGASAREAVEAAIEQCSKCGGEIQEVELG